MPCLPEEEKLYFHGHGGANTTTTGAAVPNSRSLPFQGLNTGDADLGQSVELISQLNEARGRPQKLNVVLHRFLKRIPSGRPQLPVFFFGCGSRPAEPSTTGKAPCCTDPLTCTGTDRPAKSFCGIDAICTAIPARDYPSHYTTDITLSLTRIASRVWTNGRLDTTPVLPKPSPTAT